MSRASNFTWPLYTPRPSIFLQCVLGSILICVTCYGFSQINTPTESELAEQQLEQIKVDLLALANQRESQNNQLDALLLRAQQTATELRAAHEHVQTLQVQQQKLVENLNNLQQQIVRQKKDIQQQQQLLTQQVRNAYVNGYRSRLQALLSQRDTTNQDQAFAWEALFVSRRGELISKLQNEQHALQENQKKLRDNQHDLDNLLITIQQDTDQLIQLKADQQQVVMTIREQLSDIGKRVAELELNQQQLEKLLLALRDLFADIPDNLNEVNFSTQQGRLPWPIAAEYDNILEHFGTERTHGINWSGMVIECPAETTVKAIAAGRVAFADWMRGFGWLIVVEHDSGFMSLYGNNSQLLQSTGNWVRAGEIIAMSGDSFTSDAITGVYFELRQDGIALNPNRWLLPR